MTYIVNIISFSLTLPYHDRFQSPASLVKFRFKQKWKLFLNWLRHTSVQWSVTMFWYPRILPMSLPYIDGEKLWAMRKVFLPNCSWARIRTQPLSSSWSLGLNDFFWLIMYSWIHWAKMNKRSQKSLLGNIGHFQNWPLRIEVPSRWHFTKIFPSELLFPKWP